VLDKDLGAASDNSDSVSRLTVCFFGQGAAADDFRMDGEFPPGREQEAAIKANKQNPTH
jgi:hypothetical protein